MSTHVQTGPRVAALVGPYLSGKTSLLESLLHITGDAIRKGSVRESNMIGDGTPEARARHMSTEVNVATTHYMDERWTFLDCPGSVELSQESRNSLLVSDIAIVVCEADINKALTVSPILKYLDDNAIPHIVFINKMDAASTGVRETLEALQEVSERPLVLREIPIRDGENITGYVDLISERAFSWNENKSSDLIELPDSVREREQEARTELLEGLADFDDNLMEALLEDTIPTSDDIFDNLTRELQDNLVVPVFFGSAEKDHGIHRLLKTLRHDGPSVDITADHRAIDTSGGTMAQVFKTLHVGHAGKLSIARVWSGEITDGMTLNTERISGLSTLLGQKYNKLAKAVSGDIVGLGRMDSVATGDTLTESGGTRDWTEPLKPLFSMALHTKHRGDDVKLGGALSKLIDEDQSLSYVQDTSTGQLQLWGQGEMHLLIAIDKLASRYNLEVESERPDIPYKETIKKSGSQHSRHKKQSGGHGEYGDVHIDIKPLSRGTGFEFSDTVTGGVVPKQYIPAVKTGILEYLRRGPLGFEVVDIAVTLTDGQHHAVDSSEMAFKKAAGLAMREGMPGCQPVLLEPICQVHITLPNEFTSKVQRLVSGRRGQILGFEGKADWKGWDDVTVQIPQSQMHDLIIELRSMTLGIGTFDWNFDHLQELSGKEADKIIANRSAN